MNVFIDHEAHIECYYFLTKSLVHRTVNLSTDFPIKRKGNGIWNGVLRSQKWEVTLVIGVEVDFLKCCACVCTCRIRGCLALLLYTVGCSR